MLKSLNLAEKLTKNQLSALGFGPVHIQRLMHAINQESRLLEFLLKNTTKLTGSACGITCCQISIIACQADPLLNLNAYLDNYKRLTSYGLNFNLILEFVKYHQPHFLFPLLSKNFPKIAKLRLDSESLIYFVYLLENEQQIDSMLAHWPTFIDLNLTKPEFDDLINHPDFEQLMKSYHHLLEKDLPVEQVALIFKSIYPLHDYDDYFERALELFPILHLEKHYSLSSLLNILLSEQGIKKINTLHNMNDMLLEYGFTRNELMNLIDHQQGLFRIKTLAQRAPELKSKGQTPIKIISTVLDEIKNPLSSINQDEMSGYLQEIQEEYENYFAQESFSNFLSFFENKIKKSQETIECFDMFTEDINSRSFEP